MYGRKVKLRFLFVVLILITLILTAFLVLKSLEENVVYFQSPSEKWLKKIKNPERSLTKKQVGYYNYLWGIVCSQTNLTKAEKYFKKAISIGLSMDHDLAMAKLSLAGILIQKRRKREATTLLNEAKKLDKQKMLLDQIKMMQQQMKRI